MYKSAIKWGNKIHTWHDNCLMNEDELVVLKLASLRKDVVEIGSYRGGSSKIIAEVAKSLICIDPWEDLCWGNDPVKGEDVYKDWIENCKEFSHVFHMRAHSDDVHSKINERTIDLLFVDGDHSYEQCLKDLQHYVPKVKRRGVVLCHDYCWMFTGVIAATMEYFKRPPDGLTNTLAIYYL